MLPSLRSFRASQSPNRGSAASIVEIVVLIVVVVVEVVVEVVVVVVVVCSTQRYFCGKLAQTQGQRRQEQMHCGCGRVPGSSVKPSLHLIGHFDMARNSFEQVTSAFRWTTNGSHFFLPRVLLGKSQPLVRSEKEATGNETGIGVVFGVLVE